MFPKGCKGFCVAATSSVGAVLGQAEGLYAESLVWVTSHH